MKILGWIVGIIVFIVIAFNTAKFLCCQPDRSVRKVASPIAKSILQYINKNGVPDKLKDIKSIHYDLENCKEKIETGNFGESLHYIKTQNCDFKVLNKKYELKVIFYGDNYLDLTDIYIFVKQNKTIYSFALVYNKKFKKWTYINGDSKGSVSYMWDCKVCDPKLFRITD